MRPNNSHIDNGNTNPLSVSSNHDSQLNDKLADECMNAYFNREFKWLVPMPWNIGGSENHKIEGTVVGLIQNPNSSLAIKQLVSRLKFQDKSGHQGKEFATPTHAPHWYRAMSIAMWIGDKINNHDVIEAVKSWWSHDAWVRDEYRISTGPLKGDIIGWGARFGHTQGQSQVRNVIDRLINLQPVNNITGSNFFEKAKIFRDTFPALVVKELVERKLFDGIQPVKPSILYQLEIDKKDDSLICRCDNPAPGDPRLVNVNYATGFINVE